MKQTFFEDVYEVVKLIPYGRVTSYGAIANYLGTKGARMVGWAMNSSHHSFYDIPAHRVVNRSGMLTGAHHFPASASMQSRLEAEGIEVENNTIKNFTAVFWDPSKELL